MPDLIPPVPVQPKTTPDAPVPPPAPSFVHRLLTAILPQFIAYSRKGMVWFSSLGASGILELVKSIGNAQGWTEAQTLQWNNRLLLLQGVIMLVAKFWTDQIVREDAALKTGLPPPAQTITVQALPAPPVQGLPPRGEGD